MVVVVGGGSGCLVVVAMDGAGVVYGGYGDGWRWWSCMMLVV